MSTDIQEIRFTPNARRIPGWKRLLILILPCISAAFGASQTYAYAPYDYWYLIFPGLIWLCYLLDNPPKGRLMLHTFFYALGFWGSSIYWIYHSIFFYGNAGPVFTPILVILLCTFLAFIFMLCALIYSKLVKNTGLFYYISQPPIYKILTFAALWLGYQWFHSEVLAFPWLGLGNIVVDAPPIFRNFLPMVGTVGTGFLIAVFASSIYHTLKQLYHTLLGKSKASVFLHTLAPPIIIGIVSPLTLLFPQWTQPNGAEITTGLIQPNIPLSEKWDGRQTYKNIQLMYTMSQPLNQKVDLIIWPESAIAGKFGRFQPLMESASQALAPAELLSGSLRGSTTSTQTHNSIYMLQNGTTQAYDKQILVPFGEYIPFVDLFAFLIEILGLPELGLSSGPLDNSHFSSNDFTFASSICYEVAFSDRIAANSIGADALLTISDDSWFGDTTGPSQHFQMARARALENGRYLVRVANDGITAVVDNHGQVVQQLPRGDQDSLIATIPGYSGRTPFSYIGFWILFPLICIPIFLCWVFHLNNRRKINS